MRRRRYLALAGAGLLGGCSQFGGGGSDDTPDNEDPDAADDAESDTGETNAEDDAESGQSGNSTDDVGFQKQWETDLGLQRATSLNYAADAHDERAYIAHGDGLVALDLADGTEVWSVPSSTKFHTLTADADGVFAILEVGQLLAVDPETGDSLWESENRGDEQGVYHQPVTTADHVAANTIDGLHVYDKVSGDRVGPLADTISRLAAWQGQFLVPDFDHLTAYEPDGTAIWTADGTSIKGDMAIVGSTLVGGDDDSITGVDLEQGETRWTTGVEKDLFRADAVAGDGTAFVSGGFETNLFYAVDADTGEIRWQQELEAVNPFSPTALDSAVVIEHNEQAQARAPETGDMIDTISAGAFDLPTIDTTGTGRTFLGCGREVAAYHV